MFKVGRVNLAKKENNSVFEQMMFAQLRKKDSEVLSKKKLRYYWAQASCLEKF